MLPDVMPIATTAVDFKTLLTLCRKILGRSVSQGLDEASRRVEGLASFVCILDEIAKDDLSDYVGSLRDSGDLGKHIQLSFLSLMERETYIDLIEKSGLYFTRAESTHAIQVLVVVSGNLVQWRTAILNLSNGRESHSVRLFMNKVLLCLERMELGAIFSTYVKSTNPDDGTFRLRSS